jgi:uncharacterized membrane protein
MDDLLSVFQDFDVSNFLPSPERFMRDLEGWTRFFVLVAPFSLLLLGIWYFYKPPGEANHKAGFRTHYSMGSVEAWLFAQRLAGMSYMVVGGGLTVIMLIVSLFFNGEKAMGMISAAVVCVVIEALVIIGIQVVLEGLVRRAYDKNGKRRKK